MKIVVFDLDETLGYFVEFGIFWDSLSLYVSKYLNKELNQRDFNSVMDLYPEFFRPNIMNILSYLKNKKQSKECQKIMIYTNNQGSRKWCEQIVSYFETKLNKYKLFDQIISAFKINGKQIEICRTTNNKTHDDFIQCALLPEKTEICFIDDSYHEKMNHEKVYYIQPSPYFYYLTVDTIVKRFINSKLYTDSFDETQLYNIINDGHYIIPFPQNNDQHKKVFQKMIYYIKDFFYLTQQKTKTRKLRTHIGNFTRKRIINSRMPLR